MDETTCAERHENCTTTMKGHGADIKDIYRTKSSNRTLYWTLGIFFVLILGGYGYTTSVAAETAKVAADVAEVVTKGDMEKYQTAIIQAIKEVAQ